MSGVPHRQYEPARHHPADVDHPERVVEPSHEDRESHPERVHGRRIRDQQRLIGPDGSLSAQAAHALG
jgi:hypothetical protein